MVVQGGIGLFCGYGIDQSAEDSDSIHLDRGPLLGRENCIFRIITVLIFTTTTLDMSQANTDEEKACAVAQASCPQGRCMSLPIYE